MHVSLQHRARICIAASIIFVMPSFIALAQDQESATVDRQELVQEVDVLSAELVETQRRFDAAMDGAKQADTGSSDTQDFFTLNNIGLWLLWSVLVGFVLLLIAIRRSIGELLMRRESRQREPQHEIVQPEPELPAKPETPALGKRVLVDPVKVVKIKVRKIKRVTKHT